MNSQIENALTEALNKYGRVDYKGRNVASISLHHNDNDLSAGTLATLNTLPYAADCVNGINYQVKRVDQVVNLQIWK